MTDRKSDRQILSELDECDNGVTRSVLKDVCVSRLRESVDREEVLRDALEQALFLIELGNSLRHPDWGGEADPDSTIGKIRSALDHA
jgi:hypothetical protein